MPVSGDNITCNACPQWVRNNKWAKIRASESGWLFSKSGDAYCPDHLPSWVKSWRMRKQNRKGNRCGNGN